MIIDSTTRNSQETDSYFSNNSKIMSNQQQNSVANNIIGQDIIQRYGKTKEDQLKVAQLFKDSDLKVGDKWYLLSSTWYRRWSNYIGLENDSAQSANSNRVSPEKIDNHKLVDESKSTLRDDIQEDMDYVTVHEQLWWYLVQIYGVNSENV